MERSKLIKWYFVMNIYCYQENYKKPMNVLQNTLKDVYRKDIHIIGGGNRILNEHINNNLDKIILSFYPGIVFEQPEALIGRLKADLVFANSINDYNELKQICSIFKVRFNGFFLGAVWYEKAKQIKEIEEKKYIVFFEQIDIPKTKDNRVKLLKEIFKMANKNQNRNFLIKSREEYRDHKLSLYNLSKEFDLPKNIHFTDIKTCDLIQNLDLGISISSSTSIEALLANKKYIIISDFGYKNTFLNFYKNSGLIQKFKDIDLYHLPSVNPKWAKQNIFNPYDDNNINKLKTKLNEIQKENIVIDKNILIWIKLFLYYYKLFLKKPFSTFKKIRKILQILGD